MILDDLDKKILQHLSIGTSSYEELARTCNVTRNTIYRRIATLENKGIIKNTIQCIVNLDKLDITPVCIGVKIAQTDQDKAFKLLAAHRNVRLLLRTYGDYNLNLIAFCPTGKEGEIIQSISAILEGLNVTDVHVSVGFVWEKTDLNAIDDQLGLEEEINQMIERKNS